jgi:hypothetical protein
MIKIVSGVSTAAPIIGLSIRFLTDGEFVVAIPMVVVGIAAFWLPGWLLDQYISYVKSIPQHIRKSLPF